MLNLKTLKAADINEIKELASMILGAVLTMSKIVSLTVDKYQDTGY